MRNNNNNYSDNSFSNLYKNYSFKNLVIALEQLQDYQPSAQKEIIKEALNRNYITNDSEAAINEFINKRKPEFEVQDKHQIAISKGAPRTGRYYFFGVFFILGALICTPIIFNNIMLGSFGIIIFSYLAYYFFNTAKQIKNIRDLDEKLFIDEPASEGKIIIGYLLCLVGLGKFIGFELYFSGKTIDGKRHYGYDDKSRNHGLYIIIISVFMLIVWKFGLL